MPVTFVTGFLDLHEDRSKDKSVSKCFEHFGKLVATGIRLHAFISRSYQHLVPEAQNLFVEYLELEDLDIYKALQDISYSVPPTNAPHHDTANFMILINAKVEMVARAIRRNNASHYAWIDFSIFHVIRDVPSATSYLQVMNGSSFQTPYIAFPGCWEKGVATDTLYKQVNWRHCGGFFIGDSESILSISRLYETHFRNIVAVRKALIWEVNMWHYFELEHGLNLGWYRADHNDSIIRAPLALKVAASLTTIPSRFSGCRATLDSLIPQVDRVYLSIPEEYSRFPGPVELPEYLAEEPYRTKVEVTRSPDFGPATKYLGALRQIPQDNWIFFCDDDQEYAPDLIDKMSRSIKSIGAYQNHYENIKRKTSGGLVHGYVGLLVHAQCVCTLPYFPLPDAARFVDDQWMSIFCFKKSIPIYPTVAEGYQEIFKTLQDGHEKYGVDSLAGLHNRGAKVKEIEDFFGVVFNGEAVSNIE